MKKLFFSLIIVLAAVAAFAQYTRFDASNAYRIDPLTVYAPNTQGYLAITHTPVYEIDSIDRIYAYDKKNKTAYVQTARGNYAVLLKDDIAKQVQKDKSINQLKGKDLQAAIEICDKNLAWSADRYNAAHKDYLLVLAEQARKKQIEDSIREARRQDSLARVREAERQAEEQRQMAEYRATHDCRLVPRDGVRISCDVPGCYNSFTGDTIYCLGLVQDTIYYLTRDEVALGVSATQAHYAKIDMDAKKYPKLTYHLKAFADSLYVADSLRWTPDVVEILNARQSDIAIDEIKKKAPYGFVEDWGWDDDYGTVTFRMDYVNLNPKAIKYIDIYWVLKNDVNDKRGSGNFKGTGPIQYGQTGQWRWDNTLYFVAGDATTMDITKIVLTYMNGTTKTLTAREIKYN